MIHVHPQKSDAEVALMRASAQTSAVALQRCMEVTAPAVPEYALAATFGACMYFGCAFDSTQWLWCRCLRGMSAALHTRHLVGVVPAHCCSGISASCSN